MSFHDLSQHLNPGGPDPLDLQIARLLAAAITQGRLKPGDPLPGTRQLAEQLNVARYVVMGAFRELEAEQWVEIRPGSGTFVAAALPDKSYMRWEPATESTPQRPQQPGFDIPSQLIPITEQTDLIFDLAMDRPDPRRAPKEALGMAYRRAIQRHGDELLDQGEPQGNLFLRQCLSSWLASARGFVVPPEQILITRGTLMAIDLVVSSLLMKGGNVVVGTPGNRMIWEAMLRTPGVNLLPVPVGPSGLDLDALETVLKHTPVQLIHLQPLHHHPTGVSLSQENRQRLKALAQSHRVAILEEERDAVFRYEGTAPAPLAAQDPSGQVVFMGSLSGLVASGVRLGYLVAPKALIERLTRVRVRMDNQGDRVLEWALADLMRDGEMERHLRRARVLYQARRDAFCGRLHQQLGERLVFDLPEGGFGVWVKPAPGFALDRWIQWAKDRGVRMHPSSYYQFGASTAPGTRLGFAGLDEPQLEEVFRRLVPGPGKRP